MQTAAKARPAKAKLRQDPQPRHVEGVRFRLLNPDPTKKYALPYTGDQEGGSDYYEEIGYEVVEFREGGPTISGKKYKPGEEITYMGHVLMCIDKTRAEEIDQFGLFGDSGQARADRIENKIIDKRGGVDEIRGMHGIGARHGLVVENKTRPSEEEGPF